MLSAATIMLTVIKLSIIKLNVIILSAVAPYRPKVIKSQASIFYKNFLCRYCSSKIS